MEADKIEQMAQHSSVKYTSKSGMGRIRQTIKVDGQECWTLFDTGARNSYVIPSVAQILKTSTMAHAFRTALGGEVKETKTSPILEAEIEGPFYCYPRAGD